MDVEEEVELKGGTIVFYEDGHVQVRRNNGQHELLRENEAREIANHYR